MTDQLYEQIHGAIENNTGSQSGDVMGLDGAAEVVLALFKAYDISARVVMHLREMDVMLEDAGYSVDGGLRSKVARALMEASR